MQTINTIRELLDEMPVLAEISNNLPFPYQTIISHKIKEFNAYLEEIHTLEMEKHNSELEDYTSDILRELEAQTFEKIEISCPELKKH